jgi:hypothetical protein
LTQLEIYRPGTPPTLQATVDIDEKTVFSQKLMNEHKITSEFYSSSVLDITIGDYITHNSENFYLNRLPEITKINSAAYQYKCTFESVLYDLAKKLFISTDGLADYDYSGSATDFVTNIVANLNVTGSGWTVGTVATTGDKLLRFTNESCRAALTRVAEAFDLEFSIVSKSISLVAAVGTVTANSFEYGKTKGFYKLERQQVSDQNIVTKVYGFGGTRNIPADYRSRAKRLVFEDSGNRYLTKNTATYGTIEGQYTNDDIYPSRIGTLTAASMDFDYGGTGFNFRTSYVEDTSIDFDLNDYLIEGLTAKIAFKTGDLTGYEFEIWKYDATNHLIYFNPYSDQDGYTMPQYNGGSPLQAAIGDTYTLLDIEMPAAYITTAETALQTATQAYLDENCVPQVVYSLEIDPKYLKDNTITLAVGDKVTIVDTALSINTLIRVSAIEYPLVNVNKVKATIADFVPYTQQERVIKNTISTKKETVFVDRRAAESARRNSMREKQLKDLLFDTDNYFDVTNFKSLSIETAYLAVGTKSSDFWLSNVLIKANHLGDKARFYISAGSLVHLQIQITGLGYTWVIASALDQGSLTDGTAYYLYAKCSKTALTGVWVLSASQITVEEVVGYYHFLVGTLFAVADGYRDFDFMKGMTYIHGDQIKTGKVSSIDGNNYLDLTNNTFKIGDANSQLDFGVTAPAKLTLKGALVQSPASTTFPVPCYRGAYSAEATYYKGDTVTSGGSTWIWINATPGDGHTPADDAYWDIYSSIGNTGADGADGADGAAGPGVVYRGDFSESTDYFNNSLRRDIVKYSSAYYLFKGSDGTHGAWNAANWDSFGASFSSVATNILFAALAYVENLGVRYFQGVPVGAGDLAGSVATEAPDHIDSSPTITKIVRAFPSSASGSYDITVTGCDSKTMTYDSDEATTCLNFYVDNIAYYNGVGITLTYAQETGSPFRWYVQFEAALDITVGKENQTPAFDVIIETVQNYSAPVARVDTITLTGTEGEANILCDALTKKAYFNDSLTQTAADFVAAYAASYLSGGVVVTSSGADIIFTANVAGVDFTGSTTITNVPVTDIGAINIAGNEIWENNTNDDTGAIHINYKGFGGGITKYRTLIIGNGRDYSLIHAIGTGSYIGLDATYISVRNIPTSDPGGGAANIIWVDGSGYLRIGS